MSTIKVNSLQKSDGTDFIFSERNKLINGDFSVAQRGTSFTSTDSANNNESLYTNYLKGLGSKRKKELDNVSNLDKKIKKYNKTADSIKEFNTIS